MSFLINEKSTTTQLGSSVEQMMLAFYRNTVYPLTRFITDAVETQLFTDAEADELDFVMLTDELAFTDLKGRADAFAVMIHSGQRTPDEARAANGGYAAMPGGGSLYLNSASVPLESVRGGPA